MMQFDIDKYRKIKKLQGGGTVTTTVFGDAPAPNTYVPFQVSKLTPSENASGVASLPSAKPDNFKGFEGLPSDVGYAYNLLNQAETLKSQLTEVDILSNSPKFAKYQETIKRIYDGELQNKITHSKEQFKNAEGLAKDNKAMNAYVVDAIGYVFVTERDTGKMTKVKPEDLIKNPKKYIAITVPEALKFRAENKSGAFDNALIGDIETSYGIEKISDYLDVKLSDLGSNDWKNATKGLAEIKRFGEDYRGIVGEMKSGGSNATQLNYAIQTTLKLLPDNMKSQLKLQVMKTDSSIKDVETLNAAMVSLIVGNMSRALKSSKGESYTEDISVSEYGTGSGGAGKTVDLGLHQFTYEAGLAERFNLAPKGSDVTIQTYGKNVENAYVDRFITDKDNQLKIAGDWTKAVDFNGNPITKEEFNTLKSSGSLHQIVLPINKDGKYDATLITKLDKVVKEEGEKRGKPLTNQDIVTIAEKQGIRTSPFYAIEVTGLHKGGKEKEGRQYLDTDSDTAIAYKNQLEKAGKIEKVNYGNFVSNVIFDNHKPFTTTAFVPVDPAKIRYIDEEKYNMNKGAASVENIISLDKANVSREVTQ